MGIEIKELKVKFNVSGKEENRKEENNAALNSANYKKIVKECTENVLRELERRVER